MIDEYSAKILVSFPTKKSYYFNYTIDNKFKILIFKDKILIQEKEKVKYKTVLISNKKKLIDRWLEINNFILKKKSNPNFKLYYCVQVI
tara:strand:+ start:671 stop:937 length:267 start_codon:yes stop_codon:yes gene_type:complete